MKRLAGCTLLVALLAACGAQESDPRALLRRAQDASAGLRQVRYRFEVLGTGDRAETTPRMEGTVTLRPLGRSDRYQARIRAAVTGADGASRTILVVHDGATVFSLNDEARTLSHSPLWVAGPTLLAAAQPALMYVFFDPASMDGEVEAQAVHDEGDARVGDAPCRRVRVAYDDDDEDSVWCLGAGDHLPRLLEWTDGAGSEVLRLLDVETDFELDEGVFRLTAPEDYSTILETSGPPAGSDAPGWELRDADSRAVSLAALRGRVVVLEFWATWCPPCWESMAGLQELHEEFRGKPVEILAVNVMESGDPAAFMAERGLTYRLLLDGDAVHETYARGSLPAFAVIGPEGRVLGTGVGYFGAESDAYVRELILEGLALAASG